MSHIVENELMEGDYHLVCLGVSHGYRCGYVGVKPNHPYYGMDFGSVDDIVHVHGGLTFSGGAKFKDCECDGEGFWYFGFDCMHGYDKIDLDLVTDPNLKNMYANSPDDPEATLWTKEMVLSETRSLCDQLRKLKEKIKPEIKLNSNHTYTIIRTDYNGELSKPVWVAKNHSYKYVIGQGSTFLECIKELNKNERSYEEYMRLKVVNSEKWKKWRDTNESKRTYYDTTRV